MQKTCTFHVSGMHCKACVLLIESELGDLPSVHYAKANLKDNTLKVAGNFGNQTQEEIAGEFNKILEKRGYSVSAEKSEQPPDKLRANWREFKFAAPIAIGFAVLFFVLQKIGLVNLINSSKVSFGAAFLIGVIASLSSCMAVVGGLLLSMSATFAKGGDKVRPQIFFHGGRLISFFALGGAIGTAGSVFQFGGIGMFIIGLLVGLAMLVMGINLLGVFHFSRRLQFSMPKFISARALGLAKINHTLTPFIVGVATFFLPCGFTQSMQIYALSTGNFWSGALTMLFFALGTLPVLSVLSFSSYGFARRANAGIFFKTAGLVVIMFAILNIITSLTAVGFIPPILNF